MGSFSPPNSGLVAFALGSISRSQMVRAEKRTERITGVETGRRTDERGEPITWIGILVGDVPEGEIALLQARLHAGDILTIEELKRDT